MIKLKKNIEWKKEKEKTKHYSNEYALWGGV
jgi:hypothetical protein